MATTAVNSLSCDEKTGPFADDRRSNDEIEAIGHGHLD